MKTLSIIFGVISFVNAIIAYLPPKFIKAKEKINKRFLTLCTTLKNLNNDALALAVRPAMCWLGGFILILASILIQLWGKNDNDVNELSITWFGIFAFTGLALITSKEFSRRLKELINICFRYTLWVTGVLALIIIIIFSLTASYHAHINHQTLNPEPAAQSIAELLLLLLLKPLGLAFLIIVTITTLTFVAIPFLSRTIFLLFIRKVISFILIKEPKDPIKIPLLIFSFFFLCLTVYTHFSGKALL